MCENCECKYSSLVWRFLLVTVTPVNTSITFITSTVPGLHFSRWQYMRICSSANFRTVFSESQNANPLDAELEPDFNAKWPFKVIRLGINEEPLEGYIVQYNNCGHECEGSDVIASERSENRHLQRPHSHLTPPLQQTPAIIDINFTLIETGIPGLQFCRCESIGSSSNFRTVFSESQKANPLDAELEPDFNAKWPFKVTQGHSFRCQWRATKGLHSTI